MNTASGKAVQRYAAWHLLRVFFEDLEQWQTLCSKLQIPSTITREQYDTLFKGTNADIYIPLWASACIGGEDILLNLTTCGLIIFGGLGFLVILDINRCRCFHKLTLHSKVVITTTIALLAGGTVLLKLTEGAGISWLGAFFHSVSARTAGFSTYAIGSLTDGGLFVLVILMFIGASPGSTGGGIKTTTFFALMQQVRTVFSKRQPGAFRRTLPADTFAKASVIALLSLLVVCVGTLALCMLQPQYTFLQLLFEEVSAFGTVGLSTGITPDLSVASKLVIILTMFIGRLGAFTMVSIWIERSEPSARYSEEMITIG